MTPLQKGVAKEYFGFFRSMSIITIIYMYLDREYVGYRKAYIIGWICMPIIFAYDYYLRNRKKEENKPVSYWVDALKLFMVCFLVFGVIFIFLANKYDSDLFGLYFSIPLGVLLSVIFSGILASKYLWDMKQNKK